MSPITGFISTPPIPVPVGEWIDYDASNNTNSGNLGTVTTVEGNRCYSLQGMPFELVNHLLAAYEGQLLVGKEIAGTYTNQHQTAVDLTPTGTVITTPTIRAGSLSPNSIDNKFAYIYAIRQAFQVEFVYTEVTATDSGLSLSVADIINASGDVTSATPFSIDEIGLTELTPNLHIMDFDSDIPGGSSGFSRHAVIENLTNPGTRIVNGFAPNLGAHTYFAPDSLATNDGFTSFTVSIIKRNSNSVYILGLPAGQNAFVMNVATVSPHVSFGNALLGGANPITLTSEVPAPVGSASLVIQIVSENRVLVIITDKAILYDYNPGTEAFTEIDRILYTIRADRFILGETHAIRAVQRVSNTEFFLSLAASSIGGAPFNTAAFVVKLNGTLTGFDQVGPTVGISSSTNRKVTAITNAVSDQVGMGSVAVGGGTTSLQLFALNKS